MKSALKSILKILYEKRLTTVAGAWVYYFLSALIPIAFLIITAFGVFGVDVSTDIVNRLPEEFRLAGQTIVATAENASKGVTVFFVITVLFSVTTLLNQMSKDGDFIYGINSKVKRGLLRRLFALFALGALFVLFLSLAFLFAFGSMVFNSLTIDSVKRLLFTVLAFLVVVLFGYAIILVLNRFICPVRLRFKNVCVGAFVSLAIIVIGTLAFTLYLRFFNNYNAFYGSLASIVIFLLWAYILMLGLLVGVIVNMEIYNRTKKNS